MRRRDNFYFYFSITALIIIIVLIYYFYEMNYKLSEFLDVKTIFGSLGTLFGAYFGAKVAGKYAIESANRQIENNNKRFDYINHEKFLKISNPHSMSIEFTNEVLGALIKIIEGELKKEASQNAPIELIKGVVRKIRKFQNELEEIEIIDLSYSFYRELSKAEIILDTACKDLEELLNYLNENSLFSAQQWGKFQSLYINFELTQKCSDKLNELKEISASIVTEKNK